MSLPDPTLPGTASDGASLSRRAELASAHRDHFRAAELLRQALATLPDDASLARVPLLLRLAEAEQRAGRLEAAWEACRAAAAVGRVQRDGTVLADAALAAPAGAHGAWSAVAERHALAAEALHLLGDSDRSRSDRLAVLLVATEDPWSRPGDVVTRYLAPTGSAEERFELIHARHASALHVRDASTRLALAREIASLEWPRRDESLAWAALWRATSATQLGRRPDLDAAALHLEVIVDRLREPIWAWRESTVHAAIALLDGDLRRAAVAAARAAAVTGAEAPPEVGFVDLILRSEIAIRANQDLQRIDDEVREAVAHMPFFAQGWRARVLLAAGRLDEVQEIWRALAPHVAAMPEAPIEWLIAVAGFAEVAVAMRDRVATAQLLAMLLPLDGFQIAADAQTPNDGPVALLLGRMTALLDDHRAARHHLTAAVREADAMHDPHHAAAARASLAALRPAVDPLSPREFEIARLLAEGHSNREVGEALRLSVRTVENHVSHILTKLDLSSRTGIAGWYLRRSLK